MENNQKEINRTQVKCENCGGNLFYNPTTKSLSCENCSNNVCISASNQILKHPVSEKPQNNINYESWKQENKVMKCKNCGASLILNNLEYASVCPYCDSNFVGIIDDLPSYLPDGIVPFQFNQNRASELFKASVKNKFLVPNEFKKNIPEKQIKGIYIPSFVFDADSISTYSGWLVKTETETDSDGHTHSTSRSFPISGTETLQHRNVIVESSSHIEQSELKALLPFNSQGVLSFNQDYLRGYAVEHYSTAFDDCYLQAKKEYKSAIETKILSHYYYTYVRSLDVSSNYSNEMFNHTLYPVYQFNYTFKGKQYSTFMNGQTGKIGKGLPISKGKLAFIIVLVVLIILIPIIITIIISVGANISTWSDHLPDFSEFPEFLIK